MLSIMATMNGSNSVSAYPAGAECGMEVVDQHTLRAERPIVNVASDGSNPDTCAFEGVPQVGMVFPSEESVYEFYNAYARKVGFSVRKGRVERLANGTIRKRLFVCAKEGYRPKDPRTLHVRKERPQTRTGCMARMMVKFEYDGTWVIIEIISEHNHPLASPSTVYMLRSQRNACPAQGDSVDTIDDVGIRTTGLEHMSGEPNYNIDNVGFVDVGYTSHLHTQRMRSLKEGEAQFLLNYFKRMQLANPSFFYAIQVDKDDQVTNFFWVDSRSMANYSYFGDAVCLDTTYRINKCNLPFAPFLGVNNHRQIVPFGAALLLDETTDSFVWLFETWMKAMSGRQPNTFLTDQCSSIEKAISLVLPHTHHRICLWHISQNTAKKLPWVYSCDPSFQNEFKNCIYTNEIEEDLHAAWNAMLRKYKLSKNKWIEDLYEVRERWALAYGRNAFCADMATIERNESMNELFKKFLDRNLPLSKFVKCYDEVLVKLRENELHEDFNSKQTEPILCVDVPMLKQAAKEYSRKVFELFQDEYKKWLSCNVEIGGEDGTVFTYKVTQFGLHREYIVTYDSSDGTTACSCKKFEFIGILCQHVMKVLNHRNIFDLPPLYVMKRWSKNAKSGVVGGGGIIPIQTGSQAYDALRYSVICQRAMTVAAKGSLTEEAYLLAKRNLDLLLEEVEAALETGSAQIPQKPSSPDHHQRKKEKTGNSDQVSGSEKEQ